MYLYYSKKNNYFEMKNSPLSFDLAEQNRAEFI